MPVWFGTGCENLNAGIDGGEVDVVLLNLRFVGFESLGQFIEVRELVTQSPDVHGQFLDGEDSRV